MEEAISRLTLALEELEEKRREEEMQRSDGENWKKIARTIDRCSWKNKFIKKIICAITDFCFVWLNSDIFLSSKIKEKLHTPTHIVIYFCINHFY